MKNKIKIPLIILVAVGLFLYAPPLALGWLLGFLCLGILAQVRDIIDRFLLFVSGAFKKEVVDAAS